jgi:hypothetical protein
MAAPAAAQGAPLPVHAVVLPDPRDGAAGEEIALSVERLLRGSTGYDLLDLDLLQGRVGEDPSQLFERCATDVGCWRVAATAAGVEQVVLVERVDEATLGIRVVDVAATGPFRLDKAALDVRGQAEPELLDRLFFRPGALRIEGAPAEARLVLDGSYELPLPHSLDIAPLASGKHSLDIQSDGSTPLFVTVMVYPDQQTVISAVMTPLDRGGRRRVTRWTTVWALGLAAGGVVALAVESHAPGVFVASVR